MRSFSEIDTTAKRATKGVGFAWGVAEEVGKNIRLLEMFGLPGLKNLNLYFKNIKQKEQREIRRKHNRRKKNDYCPTWPLGTHGGAQNTPVGYGNVLPTRQTNF